MSEEILTDILSRLPVRSLVRFKCVSNFWETLISDPYFKMKHLSHAKNDQNSQKLLIARNCREHHVFTIYCCPLSSVEPVEDVQQLDCPSSCSKPWFCSILCSCDGLVILGVSDKVDYEHTTLLLWNPSTRESVVLPDPILPLCGASTILGFGYDSIRGDYKILKIHRGSKGRELPGEVLTLNSGSWRKLDKHPRGVSLMMCDTTFLPFVHEAFHWIGISSNYCVVSFNISNELYGEILLPEQILCSNGRCGFGLSVLDGMLCVISIAIGPQKERFKLWLLKNYDVKESWIALLTIEDPGFVYFIPRYRFADAEVLSMCYDKQCRGHVFRTSSGPFAL